MMPRTKQLSCLALLAISALGAGIVNAAPKPSAGIKGLAEIVTRFEAVGCQIVDVSFDKDHWQLKGYRNDLSFVLAVDRETGLLESMRQDTTAPLPPAGTKALSQVLAAVEKAGWTQIVRVKLKHRQWEVEADRGLAQQALLVDAIGGTIVTELTE